MKESELYCDLRYINIRIRDFYAKCARHRSKASCARPRTALHGSSIASLPTVKL